MAEHLFLCGLSPGQRAEFKGGRELHLHGARKNLRLELADIRHRLIDTEPDQLTDLVEIATYVFAADNLVSRGGLTFKNMGESWRRTYRLVVAVRQPGTWKEPQRLHALCECLAFLSEDDWSFDFVELENPSSLQDYLNFAETQVERSGGATIVLFSGGLDSYAGAVQELYASNRHVVLLSRGVGGVTDGRQRELAHELRRRHPRRITHVPVSAGLTDETKPREHTQRTRSFLLTAMALVAAEIERTDQIRFYENGVMSVNLPISTQVVGARASRSTHPRALLLLEDLCRLVRHDAIAIENPFIWKTKAEVVAELREKPEGGEIGRTLSCSRTREITRYKPHCGKCAQCLQRRISTLGAGAAKADPDESYAVDLLLGPRDPGVDRAMAVDMVRSALEFRRLSDDDFAFRFAEPLAWVATSFPNRSADEVLRDAIAMFRRHGEVVRTIFTNAAFDHARDFIDRKLADSCLLRLVMNPPDLDIAREPIVIQRPEAVDVGIAPVETAEEGELLIAVDTTRKRILLHAIGGIAGPLEFGIVSELVHLYRADRNAERAPRNYRTMSAQALAGATNSDEVAVRKAISRVRKKISSEFRALYGRELGLDAVIENVPGKGYRLNPAVRVVTPDQFRS